MSKEWFEYYRLRDVLGCLLMFRQNNPICEGVEKIKNEIRDSMCAFWNLCHSNPSDPWFIFDSFWDLV